jgi:hypothetical protein
MSVATRTTYTQAVSVSRWIVAASMIRASELLTCKCGGLVNLQLYGFPSLLRQTRRILHSLLTCTGRVTTDTVKFGDSNDVDDTSDDLMYDSESGDEFKDNLVKSYTIRLGTGTVPLRPKVSSSRQLEKDSGPFPATSDSPPQVSARCESARHLS